MISKKIKLTLTAAFIISTVNSQSVSLQNPQDSIKVLGSNSDSGVVFQTVQIEAKFPGGSAGWIEYLQKRLKANTPIKNGAPNGRYTVVVSFLVDKFGHIDSVKAENNPGYGTAEEAVRVIRKGPNWIPAWQNGKNVLYRQRQSITFLVD